ncbi:MAG: phosphoribosylanthranilate isomerase [Deferribacteraceae bacterium]|jgi:phosphoribosylanthranilate isomerase|nr:phosphoribosylanthranilate isomerase [Deferribacteraceae bacterium]
MTKIKICGISRLEDIDMVNAEKPEYVGFVFAPSRRQITASVATELKKRLDSQIVAVGVFVNAEIDTLTQYDMIDMIQLHGTEDDEYISELKRLTNKPIIKCGRSSAADYLLFDNIEAGSGKTFDWSMIGKVDKPFFLAGGLNIDNVDEAIRTVKPFAVDVSSGVESGGVKDYSKIKEFIRRVRNGQ